MDIRVYGKGVYWLSIISWTTCNMYYMKLFKAGKIFNQKESNVSSKNPNFLPTPLMPRRKFLQFTRNDADLDPTSGQKMLRNSGVRYSHVFCIHYLSSS